jgi:hypothetical protein
MRIKDSVICSRCGKPAIGSVDITPGVTPIAIANDGTFEWAGHVELFWNETRNVSDSKSHMWVQCPDGHEWVVEVDF